MKKTKKSPPKAPPLKPDAAEPEMVEHDVYRLLPYPNPAAIQQFSLLGMKPPQMQEVFLTICIGPETNDLYALGCVGVKQVPKGEPPTIEILNAFALDHRAYVALCEAFRAILRPFGFVQFEGHVNILSATMPYRVVTSEPYHVPVVAGSLVQ